MVTFNNLQHWFLNTPLGQQVLHAEQLFYHNTVHNIFGYYALQVNLSQINFLQKNKISAQYVINHDIKCDTRFLPFATDSIDLIICPHTLELTDNYHHFLQECYRVLIPKGKIIITSFNKKSLLGLFNQRNEFLKNLNYVSLNKLKQQLHTLNFQICGGQFFSYIPPINNADTLSKLGILDKIGDRWFPTFANCYGIIASKEVITPTLIPPQEHSPTSQIFEPNLGITSKVDANQ